MCYHWLKLNAPASAFTLPRRGRIIQQLRRNDPTWKHYTNARSAGNYYHEHPNTFGQGRAISTVPVKLVTKARTLPIVIENALAYAGAAPHPWRVVRHVLSAGELIVFIKQIVRNVDYAGDVLSRLRQPQKAHALDMSLKHAIRPKRDRLNGEKQVYVVLAVRFLRQKSSTIALAVGRLGDGLTEN